MLKKTVIIVFFSLLLLPNVLGFMFRGAGLEKNTENRVLAESPTLSWSNLQALPGEIENYINDHVPFRGQWINAYATLNIELFQSIDHSGVVIGKEDWLFYTGNESMIDMLGVEPFTSQQYEVILQLLLETREKYTDNPQDFIFYIAPNKETVYSKYLPDYYTSLTGTSKALELVSYIRTHSDIQVIYPVEELKKASKNQLLYYKTDTHWNQLGGYVGTDALTAVYGNFLPDYESLMITYMEGKRGDLGNLGYTPMRYLQEQEVIVGPFLEDVTVTIEEKAPNDTPVKASAINASDPRHLVMVHDSFGNAMKIPLTRQYQKTTFVDWTTIEEKTVHQLSGDLFVYEIVERNLGKMTSDLETLVHLE